MKGCPLWQGAEAEDGVKDVKSLTDLVALSAEGMADLEQRLLAGEKGMELLLDLEVLFSSADKGPEERDGTVTEERVETSTKKPGKCGVGFGWGDEVAFQHASRQLFRGGLRTTVASYEG